jgi:hypothetical protein
VVAFVSTAVPTAVAVGLVIASRQLIAMMAIIGMNRNFIFAAAFESSRCMYE